jgi:NTP pyrophosphatase (non-canonical NTP hydrolase)
MCDKKRILAAYDRRIEKMNKKMSFTDFLSWLRVWQTKTFPKADSISQLCHLLEEIVECKDAIYEGHLDKIKEEYADCFLLLFGSAMSQGLTFHDIFEAMKQKMEINKQRKWGKPDENGSVKHINAE